MDKSHVSLEQKLCCVCGLPYDTNSLLIDKKMKNSLEPYTITGWGACSEHQKLADEGYIALVGISNEHTTDSMDQSNAIRTGSIAHVKGHVFQEMFNNARLEPDRFPMVFVQQEVIEHLALVQQSFDGVDTDEHDKN